MNATNDFSAKIAYHEQEIAALREQEAAVEAANKRAVIDEIVEKIRIVNLRPTDLFTVEQLADRAPTRQKVVAKYRNSETGETWSGRGKNPAWIAGKDKSHFLIAAPNPGAAAGVDDPTEASGLSVCTANTVEKTNAPTGPTSVSMEVLPTATAMKSVSVVPAIDLSTPGDDGHSATWANHEEVTTVLGRNALNAEPASGTAHPAIRGADEGNHFVAPGTDATALAELAEL